MRRSRRKHQANQIGLSMLASLCLDLLELNPRCPHRHTALQRIVFHRAACCQRPEKPCLRRRQAKQLFKRARWQIQGLVRRRDYKHQRSGITRSLDGHMQRPGTLTHADVAHAMPWFISHHGELTQQLVGFRCAAPMQGFAAQHECCVGSQQIKGMPVGPLHTAISVAQNDAKTQAVHQLAQTVIPFNRGRELLCQQKRLPQMGGQVGEAIGVLFVELCRFLHRTMQGEAQIHPTAYVLQRAHETAQSQSGQPLLKHGPGFVTGIKKQLIACYPVQTAQRAMEVQPRVVTICQTLRLGGQARKSARIPRRPEDLSSPLLEAKGLNHGGASARGYAQPIERSRPARWLRGAGIQIQQQLIGFAQVSGRATLHKKSFSTPGATNSYTALSAPRAGQPPSTAHSVPNAPGVATVDSLVSFH